MSLDLPPVPNLTLFPSSPISPSLPYRRFASQWESKVKALPSKKEVAQAKEVAEHVNNALDSIEVRDEFLRLVAFSLEDKVRDAMIPEAAEKLKAARKVTPQTLKGRLPTMALSHATPILGPPLSEHFAFASRASILRDRPVPQSPIGNAWSGEHFWKPQFSPSPLHAELPLGTESPQCPGSPVSHSLYEDVLEEVSNLASEYLEESAERTVASAEIEAAQKIVALLSAEIEEVYGFPSARDALTKVYEASKAKDSIERACTIRSVHNTETWLWEDSATGEYRTSIDRAREELAKLNAKREKNGEFDLPASILTLVWATKILDDIVNKHLPNSPAKTLRTARSSKSSKSFTRVYLSNKVEDLEISSDEEEFKGIKSIREELADQEKRDKASSIYQHARDNSLGWKRKTIRLSQIRAQSEDSRTEHSRTESSHTENSQTESSQTDNSQVGNPDDVSPCVQQEQKQRRKQRREREPSFAMRRKQEELPMTRTVGDVPPPPMPTSRRSRKGSDSLNMQWEMPMSPFAQRAEDVPPMPPMPPMPMIGGSFGMGSTMPGNAFANMDVPPPVPTIGKPPTRKLRKGSSSLKMEYVVDKMEKLSTVPKMKAPTSIPRTRKKPSIPGTGDSSFVPNTEESPPMQKTEPPLPAMPKGLVSTKKMMEQRISAVRNASSTTGPLKETPPTSRPRLYSKSPLLNPQATLIPSIPKVRKFPSALLLRKSSSPNMHQNTPSPVAQTEDQLHVQQTQPSSPEGESAETVEQRAARFRANTLPPLERRLKGRAPSILDLDGWSEKMRKAEKDGLFKETE
ncbi:hypothetical protein P280DRAFT_519784 [Massarina eburnea CBS 473.64]|uniref:Uncharacterized protein n=1 Tax=Massarina eburnea CBS 473.64 TaxID=1395130 RepID=A0A6A6RWV2_9PLEO|nr:hypothetical protein P280DRAFT_519784 [Massarina eburnea CBS 473.64]